MDAHVGGRKHGSERSTRCCPGPVGDRRAEARKSDRGGSGSGPLDVQADAWIALAWLPRAPQTVALPVDGASCGRGGVLTECGRCGGRLALAGGLVGRYPTITLRRSYIQRRQDDQPPRAAWSSSRRAVMAALRRWRRRSAACATRPGSGARRRSRERCLPADPRGRTARLELRGGPDAADTGVVLDRRAI